MNISPADLRRRSLVTGTSLTAAAIVWCGAFALLVMLDEFGAPPALFAASLVVCLVAFAYVVIAVLVTWAYTEARKRSGRSVFFDGPNPLTRLVLREAIKH